MLNQQRLAGEGEEEMEGVAGRGGGTMPDLLASGLTTPPDIQLSSQPAPDVTAHSRSMPLPPDIATAAAGTSSGHLGSSREYEWSVIAGAWHSFPRPSFCHAAARLDRRTVRIASGGERGKERGDIGFLAIYSLSGLFHPVL